MNTNVGNAKLESAQRLEAIHWLITEHRFESARRDLAEIAPAINQSGDSVLMGTLLYARAALAFHNKPPREVLGDALKAYELISATAENLVIGRLQALLGKIHVALGDLKAGEAYIRDAISSFRRIEREDELVGCYNKLAQVYFIRGEFKLADNFLSDSLEILENSPERTELDLNKARGNRARVQTLLGDWKSARQALESCVEVARQSGSSPSEAKNLLSLGYVMYLQEEYALARQTLERAYELIRQNDLIRERAIYHEYMGEVSQALGDLRKAREHYVHAIEIGNRIAPESAIISQTERRIAELEYRVGNLALAEDHARRARDVAEKVGELVEIATANKILAALKAIDGDYAEAAAMFGDLISSLDHAGEMRELAQAYFTAGKSLLRSSEHRKVASRYLHSALRLAEKLSITSLRIACNYQFSVLEVQSGNHDEALNYLTKCEAMAADKRDDRAKEECRILRMKIEEDMVDAGLSSENEFSLFSSLLSRIEYGSLKTGSLEDTLKVLCDRLHGKRAFILTYDATSNNFEALAALGIEQARLSRVARALSNGRGGSLPLNRPLLVSNLTPERRRMFDYLGVDDDKISGFLSIPIQLSPETNALIYVDRNQESVESFSQANLQFAIAFSDIIAFKSSEEQKRRLAEDNRRLKDQLQKQLAFPNIITANPEMLETLERVSQVKDSPISILIEGETGTGKDLLAKAIHYNSNRKDRRFISVSCAALPETLLESELFGYKRGAFTGAEGEKVGLFEEADGGTFFLDEIGDLPLSVQVKLLRVIEEKEVVRLGDTSPRSVDVRIISATNADLKAAMENGEFRQDLYYRLSTFAVKLPSLRERSEDLPLLIRHFVSKFEPEVKIEPEAFRILADYEWPGNVRELENELKKLVLLAGDKKSISSYMISRRITDSLKESGHRPAETSGDFSLYEYLGRLEREFIVEALRKAGGVKKHAAEALSIPESTLRLKMKQYHIAVEN